MKDLDPMLKGLENIVWWAVNVMKCPYQIGDRVEVRTEEGVHRGTVTSFMMKRVDDMAFFLEIERDDGEKLTPKRPVDIVRKIDEPGSSLRRDQGGRLPMTNDEIPHDERIKNNDETRMTNEARVRFVIRHFDGSLFLLVRQLAQHVFDVQRAVDRDVHSDAAIPGQHGQCEGGPKRMVVEHCQRVHRMPPLVPTMSAVIPSGPFEDGGLSNEPTTIARPAARNVPMLTKLSPM